MKILNWFCYIESSKKIGVVVIKSVSFLGIKISKGFCFLGCVYLYWGKVYFLYMCFL